MTRPEQHRDQLPDISPVDDDQAELDAAAAAIEALGKSEPLPADLRRRVLTDAARWFDGEPR